MTIKSEFKAAALQVFDEFISINIAAVYLEKSAGYVAGGNLNGAPIEHDIRVIRESSQEAHDSLGVDVAGTEEVYMLLFDELPVRVKTKDYLSINGVALPIIATTTDSAEAVVLVAIGSFYTKAQI